MFEIVFNDYSYLEEYKPQINKRDFWQKVIIQLNKDVCNGSDLILLIDNVDAENPAKTIIGALSKYLPGVTQQLPLILYRVDINEKTYAELSNLPKEMYYCCFSEVILKRIIQKVFVREMYSQNKIG